MSGNLVKLLSDLKEREALQYVEKALAEGGDPFGVLDEAREGIDRKSVV